MNNIIYISNEGFNILNQLKLINNFYLNKFIIASKYIKLVLSRMESSDQNKIYKIAVKAAKRAGKYLLKRFKNGDANITKNYKHDIKLDVDVNTEEIIKFIILKYFPDHGFICEESGSTGLEKRNKWIIDPLDGTVNFVKGIPHFCTSIALKRDNSYLVGVVYDPIRDEMFSASRDIGSFLNGKPLHRIEINNLNDAIVSGGFFKAKSLEIGERIFENLSPNIKKIRFFGSAALDLCYLAAGRFNAYIQYSVNEWDIAAAYLIAEMNNVEFDIKIQDNQYNVVASDPNIFNKLINFI